MAGLIWTDQEINTLKSKYILCSQDELCGLFPNRTYEGIKLKAQKLGLNKLNMWSDEDENLLKELWHYTKRNDLIQIFGRTWDSIEQKAKLLGLQRQRGQYKGNEPYHYFFDDIGTKEQAYVLGYWIGDGSLTANYDKRQYVVRFSSNDKDILELIRSVMQSDHNISEGANSHISQYSLNIGSKTLTESLLKMGFTNQKSYDAFLPNIPNHLYSHLARGLLDSDGSVKTKKDGNKRYLAIDFNGTYNLMYELSKKLPEVCSINTTGTDGLYRITFAYRKAREVCKWLYQDSESLRLDRKYQRYLEAVNGAGFFA